MSGREKILIVNRKATYLYFIHETWEAGIMLTGTEIKSLRQGKANLNDAYCYLRDEGLFIKNMHISPYEFGGFDNHAEKRDRKLLLHKRELTKMRSRLREKGLTLIPLKAYLNERGYAKLEIGLARGKKLYDKRESLKKAEAGREIGRLLKSSRN